MDYTRFCERCKHYEFNLKEGIICGLTKAKPKFEDTCNDFLLDENREHKISTIKRKEKNMIRPEKVSTALVLLYVYLFLSVLGFIIVLNLILSNPYQTLNIGFAVFLQLCSIGFGWFFIYMIGEGRNWARILFLIFSIIAILYSLPSIVISFTENQISGIGLLVICQIVLRVIAFILLFHKSSSEWFRNMKSK